MHKTIRKNTELTQQSQPGDIGCNFAAPTSDTTSYGDAFNAEGGGIYALEWDSSGIRVWHFPRSAVPKDISLAPLITPDPTTWGPPQALFGGSSCDTDTYFSNMSLAISTVSHTPTMNIQPRLF